MDCSAAEPAPEVVDYLGFGRPLRPRGRRGPIRIPSNLSELVSVRVIEELRRLVRIDIQVDRTLSIGSHNNCYVNPFVRGIPAQGGWRFSSYVAAPSAIPKSVAPYRRNPVKNGGHQIPVCDEIRLPRSTAFVGPKTTKPPVGQTGGGVSPRARSSELGGKLTRGEFMRRTGSVQRGYAQGGHGSRRIIKAGDSVGNRQD